MAKIKRYGSDQPLPVLGQLTCARGQYDRENADLELRPAYMGEGITRDGIGPRNFSDSYRDEQPYANFAIHAYVRTQVRYESDQLWEAWGFSYAYRSPYAVGLDYAESMVGTLRRVERAMRKANDSDGYTTDTALLFIRAAKALGIEGVIEPSEWSDTGYAIKPLGDLTRMIHRAVEDLKPKVAA